MAGFRLTSPKVPPLTENDVERQVTDLLKWRGYFPLRQQSGLFKTQDDRTVTMGEPGMPDYIVAHKRHPWFFLEIKRPGGKLSASQQKWINLHRVLYGLKVTVVDGLEAIKAWLEQNEKPP